MPRVRMDTNSGTTLGSSAGWPSNSSSSGSLASVTERVCHDTGAFAQSGGSLRSGADALAQKAAVPAAASLAVAALQRAPQQTLFGRDRLASPVASQQAARALGEQPPHLA